MVCFLKDILWVRFCDLLGLGPNWRSTIRLRQWLLIAGLFQVGCEAGLPEFTELVGEGDRTETLTLSFASSQSLNPSFSEADSAKLDFELSKFSDVDLSFNWQLEQSLGGGLDNDFTSLSGEFTIPKDQSQFQLDLGIIDDLIFEGDETYVIRVTNTESSLTVKILKPQLSILLVDNEALPIASVRTLNSFFLEDFGNASVAVELDRVAEVDIKVSYSLSGTANMGMEIDYIDGASAPGQLSFSKMSTSTNLYFDLLTDGIQDGNKNLVVTLDTTFFGLLVGPVGGSSSHDMTILDIDGPLSVIIVEETPAVIFYDTTPIKFDIFFSRHIDPGTSVAGALDFTDISFNGTASGLSGSIVNGTGGDANLKFKLSIDGLDSVDGTIEPEIAAGSFTALINSGLGNLLSSGDSALYDVNIPADPSGWSLTSPNNGSVSSDLDPVISGTGIVNEENGTAYIFSSSSCMTAIGSAPIAGGDFSVTDILFSGGGVDDGLINFYGQVEDVVGKKSSCVDLSLSYTLDTTVIPSPSVPSNFSAFTGDTEIKLTWDPCTGCTYEIYGGTSTGLTLSSTLIVSLGVTSYAHSGLTNSTLQYYKIRAITSGGESSLSAEINAMAYPNFCAGGGNLFSGNCNISSVVSLFDNTKISANADIIIASGGELNSSSWGNISLNNLRNIIIANGGKIQSTFTEFNSSALNIYIGGLFSGDISSLSVGTVIIAGTMNSNIFDSYINSLQVDAGGLLSADGRGYSGNSGPGAGGSVTALGYPGGSYGGEGGANHSGTYGGPLYGNFINPYELGSGGGTGSTGANGAGKLKLFIKNSLSIDGTISASGMAAVGSNGGGSGGSIWIDVGTTITGGTGSFTGSGSVLASGGAGSTSGGSYCGGGGGGGRIALHSMEYNFTGEVKVIGGLSSCKNSRPGGSGSYYLAITDKDSLCDTGNFASGNCVLSSHRRLGDHYNLAGTNYHLASGGKLEGNFEINLTGNLTLDIGTKIIGSGAGDDGGGGPGVPAADTFGGGGAGYGGAGGRSHGLSVGGIAFGATDEINPINLGMMGGDKGGGLAGGALKITVGGRLTNNGLISVAGLAATYGGGGGSGGSLWIINTGGAISEMLGTGTISAAGGNGNVAGGAHGGGGGGGRIALVTDRFSFSGTVDIDGGKGAGRRAMAGNSGSYFLTINDLNSLCSSGTLASNCTMNSSLQLPDGFAFVSEDLTLSSGATLRGNIDLTITGDLTIDAGATIVAENDLSDFQPATPGAPGDYVLGGGGGGHGGRGGQSDGSTSNGGLTHGNEGSPSAPGGNGAGQNFGRGGGSLRIQVAGTLTNNGIISVDGGNASGPDGAGGGAGGSIWMTLGAGATGGILIGTGQITAQGGNGINSSQEGGGGGGGRIAIYSNEYKYRGSVEYGGGSGSGAQSQSGSGGTFVQTVADSDSLCDSGTMAGNDCLLTESLSLANGFNLTGTNYSIAGTGSILGNISIDLTGDLLLASGAVISARKVFSFSEAGNSLPYSSGGGGAGHGGTGGRTYVIDNGGISYGDVKFPTSLGGSDYSLGGGKGGGALAIKVGGDLENNGLISADGGFASYTGGGGAGGSLLIDVGISNNGGSGILKGTGTFSAQGGDGSISGSLEGGSGGGGRILFTSQSYSFRGSISVDGGALIHPQVSLAGRGSFYQNITDPDSLCDSGNFATTCTINTPIDVGDGLKISGVNLILAAGASLKSVADTYQTTINLTGGLTIANLAILELNFSSLLANIMQVDGIFKGNVLKSQFQTLTIGSGGLMTADGAGYKGGSANRNGLGPGRGISSGTFGSRNGDGGGYGGTGGKGSSAGSLGGLSYASGQLPIYFGSGGGSGYVSGMGGDGGGLLYLKVTSTLTVNGTISANGTDGMLGAGGGSGGSIWLEAGTLEGSTSGKFEVLGGSGGVRTALSYGGGGGGGRLAIYAGVNNFFGTQNLAGGASGGGSAINGAAGTYLGMSPAPHVIVVTSKTYTGDLGGLLGADMKCNELMASEHVGGDWMALLSTSSMDAKIRVASSRPVLNTKPNSPGVVANDSGELWSGTINQPVQYNEKGVANSSFAWTGSSGYGLRLANTCNDWTSLSGSDIATEGNGAIADFTWLNNGQVACSNQKSLYCISK